MKNGYIVLNNKSLRYDKDEEEIFRAIEKNKNPARRTPSKKKKGKGKKAKDDSSSEDEDKP